MTVSKMTCYECVVELCSSVACWRFFSWQWYGFRRVVRWRKRQKCLKYHWLLTI